MTCGVSSIPLILGYDSSINPDRLVEASAIGTDTVSANVFVSGGVDLQTLLGGAGAGNINSYTENVVLGACDDTNIFHDLAGRVSVVFYDNATNAILDITVNYVDDNNVTINSAVAVHGLVVCIGGPTGAAAVPGEDTFGFVKRYALLVS